MSLLLLEVGEATLYRVREFVMRFTTREGEFNLQDAEDKILMQIPVKWLLLSLGQINAFYLYCL